MKITRSTLLITSAILALTACTKEKEIIREVPVEQKVFSVNPDSDAEMLAKAAEQLISPYNFMLADRAVNMALEKDPSNLRAQFYKQFLKQFMVYKGILARVKPFARAYGDITKLEKTIKDMPKSPLKDFLTIGAEDIKDYTGIQNVLVAAREGTNDFRKFLRSNPDLELELNLNPDVFMKNTDNLWKESCVFIEKPDHSGFDFQCDYTNALVRKVTPADTLALSQVMAGELLYWMLYTNYGIEGIEELAKADPDGKLSNAQRQAILENNPNFGKLRKDHNFKLLTEIGSDASAAWKYFAKFQKELCPEKHSSTPWMPQTNKRPGYLFNQGICVKTDDEAHKHVEMLDNALQGIIKVAMKTADGGQAVVSLDAFLLARKPIEDLKNIAPATWNNCNEVATLRDNTLGGIFPDGQANLFISNDCKKN